MSWSFWGGGSSCLGLGLGDPEGLAVLRQVCDQLYLLQARGSRAVLQLYPENSEQVQDQSVRKRHRQSNQTVWGSGCIVFFHINSVSLSCLPLLKLSKKITCKEGTLCNFCCLKDCLGLSLKIKVAGLDMNVGLKAGCNHQHCTKSSPVSLS